MKNIDDKQIPKARLAVKSFEEQTFNIQLHVPNKACILYLL